MQRSRELCQAGSAPFQRATAYIGGRAVGHFRLNAPHTVVPTARRQEDSLTRRASGIDPWCSTHAPSHRTDRHYLTPDRTG